MSEDHLIIVVDATVFSDKERTESESQKKKRNCRTESCGAETAWLQRRQMEK